MDKKFSRSLFVFRRDLRLDDNTGVIHSLEYSEAVMPCFIFDPRLQKDGIQRNNNAGKFMLESLSDLSQQLKATNASLHCFSGLSEEVIENLIDHIHPDAIFLNVDYTSFSKKKDAKINEC